MSAGYLKIYHEDHETRKTILIKQFRAVFVSFVVKNYCKAFIPFTNAPRPRAQQQDACRQTIHVPARQLLIRRYGAGGHKFAY